MECRSGRLGGGERGEGGDGWVCDGGLWLDLRGG